MQGKTWQFSLSSDGSLDLVKLNPTHRPTDQTQTYQTPRTVQKSQAVDAWLPKGLFHFIASPFNSPSNIPTWVGLSLEEAKQWSSRLDSGTVKSAEVKITPNWYSTMGQSIWPQSWSQDSYPSGTGPAEFSVELFVFL